MYNITFRQQETGEEVTVSAVHGENILALAQKANVAIDAPCGGNGSCGKCRVKLSKGEVYSQISSHINDYDYFGGWRLACVSAASGDCTITVPDIASAYKGRLRVTDLSSPLEAAIFKELKENLSGAGLTMKSGYHSTVLSLSAPTLEDTLPDNERLFRALAAKTGAAHVSTRYTLMRSLPDILRENNFEIRCMYMADSPGSLRILEVLPSDDRTLMCGLAVDIGTTTISVLLVNLENGFIISKGSTGNGQIRYGADIINRIIEQQKPGGVERLRYAVLQESLMPVVHKLCEDANVSTEHIYKVAVAANTTMNHLLLGINANYIRTEPYIPAFFHTDPIFTREIGIPLAPGARMSIAPNIGSYVGGDITAGTLASMIWASPELSLLVDIGTNGEIVFGNSDFLVSCACSAGPAFEGGDIKCGMRATDGAIEGFTIDPETMEPTLTVMGEQLPIGLCGSGIIDTIAELFRHGVIDGRGKFARTGPRVIMDETYGTGKYVLARSDESATGREIFIDETDLDNFIRSKGAIFSAIMTMLEPLGFTPEDISNVFIAGGIGSGINIKNAVKIGMFPKLPDERYHYLGNTSLSGAYAVLMSRTATEKLSELAKSITYLELSTQPGYMDSFVAACFLPHTDTSLFPDEV
ncbi:MAG: DUF4445 domain-containing protein [Clostridiales bacterium]|nr:DUF4445 domain-containing protein [Clostridiales bacterium]